MMASWARQLPTPRTAGFLENTWRYGKKICYNRTYVLHIYRTETTASAATSATRILNNNLANRMSNKMLAALPPEAASYLW